MAVTATWTKGWVLTLNAALCVVVLGAGIVSVVLGAGVERGPCGNEIGVPLTPRQVLDCLGDDVAHVSTALATGSAVLLPDGRLLTNAHVVDPFAVVDLSFRDGATYLAVPVIGVDLERDIAVLGPIDRRSDVVLGGRLDIDGLTQGDPLFLLGYPGEIDAGTSEPTISQGILSRVRTSERHGQTFLQTDAAIGGGQSGGALVDGAGRVVGISGLSFAERFALALRTPDVQAAVDRITAGQGSPYHPWVGASAVTSGSYTVPDPDTPWLITVPPAEGDQTVELRFEPGPFPFVTVDSSDGEPLWLPPTLLENSSPAELRLDQTTYDRLLASAGSDDNVASFTVPANRYGVVMVSSGLGPGSILNFSSNVPVHTHADSDNLTPIAVGTRLEGAVEAFEFFDSYTVDLAEGQVIDIYVGSVGGDMAYVVYPSGQEPDEAAVVDDSNEGLYGLDAHGTFTAPAAGSYVIEVGTYDVISIGYILEVQPG